MVACGLNWAMLLLNKDLFSIEVEAFGYFCEEIDWIIEDRSVRSATYRSSSDGNLCLCR